MPLSIRPEYSLQQPLTVGVWTGCSGLLLGGVWGTFRSKTPTYFAVASGLQSFGLGTAFWFFRSGILGSQTFGRDPKEPRTRVKASTAAGALTGGLLGLIVRSPRSAIQAAVILSAFGWSGQSAYNLLDRRHTAQLVAATGRKDDPQLEGSPWWRLVNSLAGVKYSPLSKMDDKDFEDMLQEKVVELEADVALIDERIETLRREEAAKPRRRDERR